MQKQKVRLPIPLSNLKKAEPHWRKARVDLLESQIYPIVENLNPQDMTTYLRTYKKVIGKCLEGLRDTNLIAKDLNMETF